MQEMNDSNDSIAALTFPSKQRTRKAFPQDTIAIQSA
jgi:hypothetical protein